LKQRGWLNATVVGIGLASLFSDLSHEAVTALLPSLLAGLGVAAAALGTIEGLADGLSSVAKLYGGWWTDRLRRLKPLCAGGYAVMAVSTLVIAGAGHWAMVLVGRALAWVARGVRTPPRKALLAGSVEREHYGRAFGFERMMDTLGAVAAPALVLVMLEMGQEGGRIVLWAAIPAVLAAGAILVMVREQPDRPMSQRPLMASYRGLPRRYVRLLVWIGVFGAGDFAHSLMILYAAAALAPGLGAAGAATLAVGLYAVRNIFHAAVAYPVGVWADRTSKRRLLVGAYALGSLTAAILATGVASPTLLVVAFALGGAYVGAEETLEDAVTAEEIPSIQRGTGFGALAIVNGVGDMVSSVMTGWLWAWVGPGVAFGAAAAIMACGAVGLARAAQRTR